jgi:hypothetical protein
MFIAHLLARRICVEADLVDQLFNSSKKRLARLLLLLANLGNEGEPEPMIAKISQETLAEMIGTTRSRVSFFMNRFRKLGFIDYNGGIEVHRSLPHVVLHGQPQTKAQLVIFSKARCRSRDRAICRRERFSTVLAFSAGIAFRHRDRPVVPSALLLRRIVLSTGV